MVVCTIRILNLSAFTSYATYRNKRLLIGPMWLMEQQPLLAVNAFPIHIPQPLERRSTEFE